MTCRSKPMFQLIQRGQIYADQHGWPVIIHSITSEVVRYWRQGRINTASIAALITISSTSTTGRRSRSAPNWKRASTLNGFALCVRHEERLWGG
ncbi:DUF4222 domain-containing protein [Leclercia adecarboxylata]|uniref:DUF4222 domain-containing protein n=1 Tax=Leclercia adecarboxylata TaxID=83655 RepID=UPI003B9741E7